MPIQRKSFSIISQPAGGGVKDSFGVSKIYDDSANSPKSRYMDLQEPWRSIANLRQSQYQNIAPGVWQVGNSLEDIRCELWSPDNDHWLDCEVTTYVKVIDTPGSAAASQLYCRGGHHTSSNGCMGSAYKSRFRYNGSVGCRKEICHADYCPDRGVTPTGTIPDGRGRWLGLKQVTYNLQDGVKIELYVDDSAGDGETPSLQSQSWRKITEYFDAIEGFGDEGRPYGSWRSTDNSCFPDCLGPDDRMRGFVIYDGNPISSWTDTDTGMHFENANLGALRFDETRAQFTFFSVREIEKTRKLLT